MKFCPGLLPFMRAMYLSKSNGWYYGLEDGIQSGPSSSGYHQGDVLASWLYMMTNQPLLNQIHDNVKESFPDEVDDVQGKVGIQADKGFEFKIMNSRGSFI